MPNIISHEGNGMTWGKGITCNNTPYWTGHREIRCRVSRHINQDNHFRKLLVSIITKHTVSKYLCPQKTLIRMFIAALLITAQSGNHPSVQQQNEYIGMAKSLFHFFSVPSYRKTRINFLANPDIFSQLSSIQQNGLRMDLQLNTTIWMNSTK